MKGIIKYIKKQWIIFLLLALTIPLFTLSLVFGCQDKNISNFEILNSIIALVAAVIVPISVVFISQKVQSNAEDNKTALVEIEKRKKEIESVIEKFLEENDFIIDCN